MKKICLILLLSSLCFSSDAQKIHFSDPSNSWYTKNDWFLKYGVSGTNYYIQAYSHDTLFNSIAYHQMTNIGIREDTLAKKIYLRHFYSSYTGIFDTAEHLLYDYNLTIGDTIKTFHDPVHDRSSIYWVNQIDSTEINSVWHKVWHFEGGYTLIPPFHYYNVIEGIGCTNGLEYPLSPSQENNESIQLLCFGNQGTYPLLTTGVSSWTIYERHEETFNNTDCATLSIPISEKKSPISIFPNPIDRTTKLLLTNNLSSGFFIVYNSVGQKMIDLQFQNKTEILFGDKIFMPGIYLYRVIDDQNKESYSGKFIYR
ncbi:MAG: hypothetical protein JWQ38_750 [Flavipsychrobacter sp.]|nr:hypothetical protein [Flavipsychrobacter sp.]